MDCTCTRCRTGFQNRQGLVIHLLTSCQQKVALAKYLSLDDNIHRQRENLLQFKPPKWPNASMEFLDCVTQTLADAARVPVGKLSDMFRYITAVNGGSTIWGDQQGNSKLDSWNLKILAESLNVSTAGLVPYLLDSAVVLLPLRTGPHYSTHPHIKPSYHASTLIIMNTGGDGERKTLLMEFCSCGSGAVEATYLAERLRKALGYAIQDSAELHNRLQRQWPDDLTVIPLNRINLQDDNSKFALACTCITRWFINVVLSEVACSATIPNAIINAVGYLQWMFRQYYVYEGRQSNNPLSVLTEKECLRFIGADYLTGNITI